MDYNRGTSFHAGGSASALRFHGGGGGTGIQYGGGFLSIVTIGNLTIDLNKIPDGIHTFDFVNGLTSWASYTPHTGIIYWNQTNYFTNGDNERYIDSQGSIMVGDKTIASLKLAQVPLKLAQVFGKCVGMRETCAFHC